MNCRATLLLSFANEAEAQSMAASIAPENGAYLTVRTEGANLVAEAGAATPLSLLHTLDDALACLSAAQRSARLAK